MNKYIHIYSVYVWAIWCETNEYIYRVYHWDHWVDAKQMMVSLGMDVKRMKISLFLSLPRARECFPGWRWWKHTRLLYHRDKGNLIDANYTRLSITLDNNTPSQVLLSHLQPHPYAKLPTLSRTNRNLVFMSNKDCHLDPTTSINVVTFELSTIIHTLAIDTFL